MNYHNKRFKPIHNSENGEVSSEMTFVYQQKNNILTCEYSGKGISIGHLLGQVDDDGVIVMYYHQIHRLGKLMTGKCISTPELMANGKIRLHEDWQWTNGDLSKGSSILDEI